LVRALLKDEVTVHAPGRDPAKTEKLKRVNAIAFNAPGEAGQLVK